MLCLKPCYPSFAKDRSRNQLNFVKRLFHISTQLYGHSLQVNGDTGSTGIPGLASQPEIDIGTAQAVRLLSSLNGYRPDALPHTLCTGNCKLELACIELLAHNDDWQPHAEKKALRVSFALRSFFALLLRSLALLRRLQTFL